MHRDRTGSSVTAKSSFVLSEDRMVALPGAMTSWLEELLRATLESENWACMGQV